MSNNNILTIGIIILAIIGIVAYLLSKNGDNSNPSVSPAVSASPTMSPSPAFTPTPTPQTSVAPTPSVDVSDWKTYRNDKYGFEFKYPKKYESNKEYAVWVLNNEGRILSEWGVNKGQNTLFNIDVYLKAEKINLLNQFGSEIEGDQKVLIDNIVASKLEGKGENVLMIENENYIYIIKSSFSSLDKQEYDEYKTILLTFKFLK